MASRTFPKNILLVADRSTLTAAEGIIPSLDRAGYRYDIKLYDNLRTADIREVHSVMTAAEGKDGILSVGTGSLNDICRLASFLSGKDGKAKMFAIFATAPSMDGFASGSAPITEGNFKITYPAVQPDILIADTAVLAAAPAELKSAGFGDMIAKYIALADWRISALLTGEYYCENIASLTREALRRITSLADRVTQNDEQTAAAVMEALVFTGVAMQLAGCVRPASGAEHMISHFWEMKKLEAGQTSDFHGKKVGVATLYLCRLYHTLIGMKNIGTRPDVIDWDDLRRVFGDNFIGSVEKLNSPTVTTELTPESLAQNWDGVCRIVHEEVPEPDEMLRLMLAAGAATTADEIAVSPTLERDGYIYHAYLRHRLTLSRLVPMIRGVEVFLPG
jgi:glycerol-1-phosphate dehydrogenase [NAD(P)+]